MRKFGGIAISSSGIIYRVWAIDVKFGPRRDVPCDYPPTLKMFYPLYLSGMIVQMLNFVRFEIFNMPSVFHLKFPLRKIVCQVSPSEFWLCISRP